MEKIVYLVCSMISRILLNLKFMYRIITRVNKTRRVIKTRCVLRTRILTSLYRGGGKKRCTPL